jgi:hypothetical protein
MDRSSRRRFCRYDVKGVDGAFVVRIDVTVINLSAAGMAIETDNTLVVGRNYAFRIHQDGVNVDLNGRVMWCVLGKSRRASGDFAPVFRAGIQFEDVLSETTLKLQQLLEASAILDPTPQIFGRFVADVTGTIDVESQASFEVKKISLSGMLVDSNWKPRKGDVIPFEVSLGDETFSGHGRVAYIDAYHDRTDATRFRLGIEFTLLSDVARNLLEQYLSELISLADQVETA